MIILINFFCHSAPQQAMEMPNETKSDKESDYDCVIKGNTYSSVYYFLFD